MSLFPGTARIGGLLCLLFLGLSCEKAPENQAPSITELTATSLTILPPVFEFKAEAFDRELDRLTYEWDFGDGTVKIGNPTEQHEFAEGQTYLVTLTVTDATGNEASREIGVDADYGLANAPTVDLSLDPAQTYQTILGFGGFGGQRVYWSPGPFTSQGFIDLIVDDLGLTVHRDEVPTSLEPVNDNADSDILDLSAFNLDTRLEGHHQPLGARLPMFRALKQAGVETFIASVWSPQPWMKHNNGLDNGTDQNSAPGYTRSPDGNTNQLRPDMYEEFAESLVAYVRLLKQEADIDLYAISVQNEPRFSQFYQSCVYDGQALAEVIKVVGARFEAENIDTKLFMPEDVGWLGGIRSLADPVLADPDARQYVDAFAVHGYALDGISAGSADAATWRQMYQMGSPYGIPLWMTETSGFDDTWQGALDLAGGMYTALVHGNVEAWVFWTLSTDNVDAYSLVDRNFNTSKRYFVSKQFYRYIRPGAVRIEASTGSGQVLTIAFDHPQEGRTVLLFNFSEDFAKVNLPAAEMGGNWQIFRTSVSENCELVDTVDATEPLLLLPESVVTLRPE